MCVCVCVCVQYCELCSPKRIRGSIYLLLVHSNLITWSK